VERGARGALAALLFLLIATAAWWALALWPTPDAPPDWLARARSVCFNTGPDGMPDASGWLLLVGQPIGMLAVMMAIWGREVRAGLGAMARNAAGRVTLATCVIAIAVGLGAAAERVATASRAGYSTLPDVELPPPTYPRLDREAPDFALTDQHGDRIELDSLRGRPSLVTFAFGNCETVCPAVVKQALDACRHVEERVASGELEAEAIPRVVVISLDPWRDTPGRLSHLAHHWGLGEGAHVLTGSIDAVEAVLDGWNVARRRDPKTGDVTHSPLVYVLDPDTRIAYASTGGAEALVELVGRL
jgi:protein SCO1/2